MSNMQTNQKPSLGRIVHVVIPDVGHRAAFVVGVEPLCLKVETNVQDMREMGDDSITPLTIKEVDIFFATPFTPASIYLENPPYDETAQQPGSWHWPERE